MMDSGELEEKRLHAMESYTVKEKCMKNEDKKSWSNIYYALYLMI